jgi:hypothetical protein
MISSMPTRLRYRGLLIHFSHYDPNWIQRKAKEERFDLRTGLKVVDAMADVGMNLLVIDIEDGVVFDHPAASWIGAPSLNWRSGGSGARGLT